MTTANAALIRKKLLKIKGERVILRTKEDRGRTANITGVIDEVYPAIFTIRAESITGKVILSYTYCDIISGRVKILRKKER